MMASTAACLPKRPNPRDRRHFDALELATRALGPTIWSRIRVTVLLQRPAAGPSSPSEDA